MGPTDLQVLNRDGSDPFDGLTVSCAAASSLLGISTYTLDRLIADRVFTVERAPGSHYRVIALTRVLAVRRWMLAGSPVC